MDEQVTKDDRERSLQEEETFLYTLSLFQEGTNDAVVDTGHQNQGTSSEQVDTNISFHFAILVIALNKQVNRGYEEGSSADENSELEHQSQRKFPDQVATNPIANPIIL